MKNKLLITTIILLTVLNMGLLYIIKKNTQNKGITSIENIQLKEQLDKTQWNLNVMRQTMMLQQRSESTPFGEVKVKRITEIGNIPFKTLIQKEPYLCFRFKETDCDACINRTTKLLTELAPHFPQKIMVLSGYANMRQFYAFAQTYKDYFSVFNVDTLPVAAENQSQPYFFIVTPDMRIQNVFILTDEIWEATSEYIHNMEHKYWNVHCEHKH